MNSESGQGSAPNESSTSVVVSSGGEVVLGVEVGEGAEVDEGAVIVAVVDTVADVQETIAKQASRRSHRFIAGS